MRRDLPWHLRPITRLGFSRVVLNAVGVAVLVATGLLAGALLAALARVPLWLGALAGVAGTWVTALVLDRLVARRR